MEEEGEPELLPEKRRRRGLFSRKPLEDTESIYTPKPEDEEPEEDTTARPPTTIYDTDGSILYTDDPALLNGGNISPATLPYTVDSAELFLTKPFDTYTVTEGFLLLGLVLGFILLLWKLVKGVF